MPAGGARAYRRGIWRNWRSSVHHRRSLPKRGRREPGQGICCASRPAGKGGCTQSAGRIFERDAPASSFTGGSGAGMGLSKPEHNGTNGGLDGVRPVCQGCAGPPKRRGSRRPVILCLETYLPGEAVGIDGGNKKIGKSDLTISRFIGQNRKIPPHRERCGRNRAMQPCAVKCSLSAI